MSDELIAKNNEQLKELGNKISRYKAPYSPSKWDFKFIPELEEKYFVAWKKAFYETEYKIHLWTLLIYLSFFWIDIMVAGNYALMMTVVRFALSFTASSVYLYLLSTHQEKHIDTLVAGFIFLAGASLTCFALLLNPPLSYVYPFGLIGVQMAAILLLRHRFRLFLMSAIGSYILYILVVGYMLIVDNLEQELLFLILVYIAVVLCFWGFFIFMGGFLSYNMEKAKRSNFVKTYLLGLEGERQSQMIDLLHQVSLTDSLTGMFNRRYFDRQLETEWRRGMRDSHFLSVVMIDVDFFKNYNDTYGHQLGDVCLKKVAQLIVQKSSRAGDVMARYGGEEFVWLLPNTQKDKVKDLVDELRQDVQNMQLTHTSSPFNVITISAGVATLVPNINASSKELIQMADACLYQAKERGRNQIVS